MDKQIENVAACKLRSVNFFSEYEKYQTSGIHRQPHEVDGKNAKFDSLKMNADFQ